MQINYFLEVRTVDVIAALNFAIFHTAIGTEATNCLRKRIIITISEYVVGINDACFSLHATKNKL